jgi:hypothetical protein
VAKGLLEDKRNETTLNSRYTEVDVGEIGDPRRVPGHIWKNGRVNLNGSACPVSRDHSVFTKSVVVVIIMIDNSLTSSASW